MTGGLEKYSFELMRSLSQCLRTDSRPGDPSGAAKKARKAVVILALGDALNWTLHPECPKRTQLRGVEHKATGTERPDDAHTAHLQLRPLLVANCDPLSFYCRSFCATYQR